MVDDEDNIENPEHASPAFSTSLENLQQNGEEMEDLNNVMNNHFTDDTLISFYSPYGTNVPDEFVSVDFEHNYELHNFFISFTQKCYWFVVLNN